MKSIRKWFKYSVFTFLCWFLIHQVVVISDGLNDEEASADVAVVFGNTVNQDGTLSNRLKARLDRGLQLYKDSLVNILFVSGGLGKEGHFEGTKMQEYLVEKGIPEESIIVDNEGNNTNLTVQNFKRRFALNTNVTVVTQFYHVSRAKLAFRKNGFESVHGVHCEYFEGRDFYACIREFFAYYKYLLFL